MKKSAKLLRQRAKTAIAAFQDAKLKLESLDAFIHTQKLVVYKLNRELIDQGEAPVDFQE